MKRAINIFSFLLLIAVSCESPTSNETPTPPLVLNEQLQKINIEQTDYTVIQFQNMDDLYLDSLSVSQIIIGYFDDQNFISADSILPDYQITQNDKYLLSFSDSLGVPDSTIFITVGLKYLLTNNYSLTITKNLFLLSYPYSSTQFLIYYSNFVHPYIYWIKDFVYNPPLLYYNIPVSEGIYEYNFNTSETTCLYPYLGGDYIDANSTNVFIDYRHRFIWRYNIAEDSVDAELDLYPVSNPPLFRISGIAVTDSLVYVLVDDPGYLLTLNTDLVILEIKDFTWDWQCLSMTYSDGYLYSVSYSYPKSHIIKIDPTSAQVLDSRLCPSIFNDAIKIYDGKLYFVDGEQKSFGYTPLEDIFN